MSEPIRIFGATPRYWLYLAVRQVRNLLGLYARCRHCGAQVHSYRRPPVYVYQHGPGPRLWAHRSGEAHCDAPCPRFLRRCWCTPICDCGRPIPSWDMNECLDCEELSVGTVEESVGRPDRSGRAPGTGRDGRSPDEPTAAPTDSVEG